MASASPICLMARASSIKSWLWHQRLSHLNFDNINDLAKNDLVSGLPKFKYHKEHLCPSREQGKSKRASHPPKPVPNSRQRVYNRRTKKIIETMNVSFNELSAMAFEQRSSKPELQSMTSGQISSGVDLTYAPSTITTQQPTEGELDLLFEAMYDDYIGGQPSAALRTILAVQAHQNVKEAMIDSAWIESMQEELLQFKRLDVQISKNPSLRLLEWKLSGFLAHAAQKSFTVFQMDVKTAFLHGTLKEDIFSDTIMSDSEDSTVTYTTVSRPYEGRSGDVSLGVDGPPVMPKDPYAYVVAAFQALPPPDYVPGPEELEQAPPSPVYIPYVPKPVYPEYIPPEDDVFPAEEQPPHAAATPTIDSTGYIPDSDLDEDLEDDDDEDSKEDPADYLADHDDEEEEEEPSGDDADEEDEEQ
nr:ribonuclease H-like domain-containing protein [Tanacetum cinerariifolium]